MTPFHVRRILAPTDLSDSSLAALRYAAFLVRQFRARLTIFYAEAVPYPLDYSGPAESFYYPLTADDRQKLRDEVVRHAQECVDGVPYEIDVAAGFPIPTILQAAKTHDADLLVMGTHLRHGWRRALLGSVSEGVIHGSSRPVLTVARQDSTIDAPLGISRIVCPVNLSDVARESLRVAVHLARSTRAQLSVVHVREAGDDVLTAEEQAVREWIGGDVRDCSFEQIVLRGGAAERVLDYAEDLHADLLVIGAQHRVFRDTTVIGTTSERLIRYASCPVLVVPRSALHGVSGMEG